MKDAIDAEARTRIEALEGKVLAAHAAIRALIACHPDQNKALVTVSEHLDRFAGIALAGSYPEAMTNALASADRAIFPTEDELLRARH